MQFLSPIWFTALAALSIPVIIHLWNIRPGKTLKVGSISLITEASKITSRSFKLLDVLLLLCRCLLLSLLAVFLGKPVWNSYQSAQKAKGWLLIPKENLNETYQKFKPRADSLTAAGYEFHYFNKNFGGADLKKTLADSVVKDSDSIANYWSLIKQLNSTVPPALPVYVFTPNRANNYIGDKPAIALNLHWQTYTAKDSVSKWIAAANFTNHNTIKITQGNSSPEGTNYTQQTIQNDGNADVGVEIQGGLPKVKLKNSREPAVSVDTGTLHIAVFTDKYPADAEYLKAALNAVISFTGQKAVVKQYSQPGQIPAKQHWLFWLSEQPVSSRLLNSSNIFKYEKGKGLNVNTWVNKTPLFKRIETTDKHEAIWEDGFGKPVLSLEKRQTNIYHFYSHFNPLWNDMVWNNGFPQMMLKLIDGRAYTQPGKYDRRILSDVQLQPGIITKPVHLSSLAVTQQTDVSKYLWLVLVALFITERLLAYKTKQVTNG
jgi:hypothetical protein